MEYNEKGAGNSFEKLLAEFVEKTGVKTDGAGPNSIDAINAAELAQRQNSGLGFPKSKKDGKREMGFARFEFDELHFRAVLAALITKDGPVKMADFLNRLALYQEDILQDRKDALLKTTLEPPSVPWSGFAFAESAAHIYKAMEDSEWHRVSAE